MAETTHQSGSRGIFLIRSHLSFRILLILLVGSLLINPISIRAEPVQAEELPAPLLLGESSSGQIISAGADHSCGIKADGSIICWGDNTSGQLDVPAPNNNFKQVSVGYDNSCGLKSDGSLVCWGSNSNGKSTVPAPNSGFTQVSVGLLHTCGVKSDQSLICWGSNADGRSTIPAPNSNFSQVSSGGGHTCGLKNDGSLVCWGTSTYGLTTVPTPNSNFMQIDSGNFHNCGLKNDGSLVCWGRNTDGQTTIPSPNSGFSAVSAGADHTCARKTNGSILCWGDNWGGKTSVPAPNSNFVQLSAGSNHTCGLKGDGSFICWGYDLEGQVNPNYFVDISAGAHHSCGIKKSGYIICWGDSSYNTLSVPSPNTDFYEVSAGWGHTCGIKIDGSIVCWGGHPQNDYGSVPTPNTDWRDLSVGGIHSCAIKDNNDLYCWKENWYTFAPTTPAANYYFISAGDGTTCATNSGYTVDCWGISDPSPNSGMYNVSVGSDHGCVLRGDESVLCWGSNTFGKTTVPAPNSNFAQNVSVGMDHSCARKLGNSIICWGSDAYGQSSVPAPNSGFWDMDAGHYHTCGRRSDGRVSCWGLNDSGQTDVPLITALKAPPISQPPMAVDDNYTTLEDTPLVVDDLSGVLANDLDPDSPSLTAIKDTNPTQGTVTLSADGSFTYTPTADLCGPDSFTYHAFDGDSSSTSATVNLTVTCVNDEPSFTTTDPPAVNEDAGLVIVNNWAVFNPGPPNESSQAVFYYSVSNLSNPGLFDVAPAVDWDGHLYYWPAANAFGTSTFDIFVVDDGGTANGGDDTSQTQTFTITVNPVNDRPTTSGITNVNVLEDATNSMIDLWPSFDDLEDLDGSLTYSESGNTNPGLFSSVSITGIPNQYLELDYALDQNGSSDITVMAEDTGGLSRETTFTVTVQPVNDQPDFTASDPPAVNEDASLQTIIGWATFDPGPVDEAGQSVQAYTVSNISNPGLFSQVPAASLIGTLTYQLAANQNGSSTFDVLVQDDGGTANGGVDTGPIHTFTIQVNPVNDPPTYTDLGTFSIVEDTPGVLWDIWPDFDDLEDTDSQLSFSIQSYTNPGLYNLVTMNSDRYLMLAFVPDEFGSSTITVRATDTGSLFVDGDLNLEIRPVNDPPSFTAGGDVTVPQNSGLYSGGWASSISAGPSNESGQTLTFQVSNDNPGLFSTQPSIAPDGTLSFTPTFGLIGSALVSVTLTDDGGTADGGVDTSPTEVFTITVAPFPTVTGIVVTGATPVLPGSTIVERIRFLRIRFDLDLDNPPGDSGIDDATNPANYLLVRSGVNGIFDTSSCLVGVAGDDVNIVVNWVRYPFGGDSARIYINGGFVLQTGDYRLLVCGATSITAGGIPLAGDGVNSGTDYLFDFSVILPSRLPDTGFPPDKITHLSGEASSADTYQNSGLILDIPRLGLSIPITSIPFQDTTWDVTWLSNQVGWLDGTAFPTWGGNSVLTGHVVNPSGLPGPFADLGSLRYGDQIIIQGWGQNYIYEVRSVKTHNADNFSSALQHEEYPWITLITCTGYTPYNEIYSSRIIIKAVQVGIR